VKPPDLKGPVSKALEDALTLRQGLIADGTPEHEADYIVGQGLKAVIGGKREREWQFYCATCKDTGWINIDPAIDEQGRLVKFYGEQPDHHGYVVKCEPCKWTTMQREKRRAQGNEFEDDDDPAGAGRMKPQRKFSRFGGR
jgi:hypothetical protein